MNCCNYDCTNKYQCKKYVTKNDPDYQDAIDLKDKCNKVNGYAQFSNWKGKNDKD